MLNVAVRIVTTGLKEWRDLTIYELTLNTHSLILLIRNQTYLSVRSVANLTDSTAADRTRLKIAYPYLDRALARRQASLSLSLSLSFSLKLATMSTYLLSLFVAMRDLESFKAVWATEIWNIALNLKASCMAQFEQYCAVCHLHWVWLYCEASLKIPQRVRNSLRRDSEASEADIIITDCLSVSLSVWLTDWLTSKLHTGRGTVVSICTVRCNVQEVCSGPARRRRVRRVVGFTKQH
jgi:hypothetical protein